MSATLESLLEQARERLKRVNELIEQIQILAAFTESDIKLIQQEIKGHGNKALFPK